MQNSLPKLGEQGTGRAGNRTQVSLGPAHSFAMKKLFFQEQVLFSF